MRRSWPAWCTRPSPARASRSARSNKARSSQSGCSNARARLGSLNAFASVNPLLTIKIARFSAISMVNKGLTEAKAFNEPSRALAFEHPLWLERALFDLADRDALAGEGRVHHAGHDRRIASADQHRLPPPGASRIALREGDFGNIGEPEAD